MSAANVSVTLTTATVSILGEDHYQITTSGLPNQAYDVQAITDGVGDWTTIDTTTAAANGVIIWTDPDPISEHTSRIYRLAQQ